MTNIALDVWVTDEQEGLISERVLRNLLLLCNPDAQSSVRATPPNSRSSHGDSMKIGCHCGATISDSSDYIPHKAHLTPDQNVYEVWDGIDDEVIDPLASSTLSAADAYMVSRRIICSPTRLMWQCVACGRLYIDGLDGELNCFVPESEETDKQILRGKVSK